MEEVVVAAGVEAADVVAEVEVMVAVEVQVQVLEMEEVKVKVEVKEQVEWRRRLACSALSSDTHGSAARVLTCGDAAEIR